MIDHISSLVFIDCNQYFTLKERLIKPPHWLILTYNHYKLWPGSYVFQKWTFLLLKIILKLNNNFKWNDLLKKHKKNFWMLWQWWQNLLQCLLEVINL